VPGPGHGVCPGSEDLVRTQLDRVYLATCPFCDYRELFSSDIAMLAVYGAHLLDHEDDARDERRAGGTGMAQRMDRIARHLQRLNTAQFN
jgi:hypothetical protein